MRFIASFLACNPSHKSFAVVILLHLHTPALCTTTVKPRGVILRHDYSTAEGPTRFWDWLARKLPVFQIEDAVMLCLRVDSEEVCNKTQAFLQHPLLKDSVRLPAA